MRQSGRKSLQSDRAPWRQGNRAVRVVVWQGIFRAGRMTASARVAGQQDVRQEGTGMTAGHQSGRAAWRQGGDASAIGR